MSPDTGALLLGAGFSRRFGSDKRLHVYQDKPIAVHTVRAYSQVFEQLAVVIRPEDTTLARVLEPLQLSLIFAEDAHLGMGHSLAAGISAIDWEWTVVGLLDMPFIRVATLQLLKERIRHTPQAIVRFKSPPGHPPAHPVAWHKTMYDQLRQARGDQGGKSILQQHRDKVDWLECDDPGLYRDVDRPDDLD